ncbi:ABC transporter permease [Pseudomonas graminis]|uniref:Transport permease protein n=1 Tax=Pseudomonas graminis TaxID=158627 RepID=A0A6M8MIL2_9PSED|nr:ABC transporter permease [Pseudomonas graminis]QKF49952.1 Teichoic acid translocation permease protein TagG [Pseudomonas graminis]
MQTFSPTPKELIASVWRHRALITAMVKREVIGRYKGSMLGMLWSLFNPIVMLAIYTFVFSVVFKARWSVDSTSKTEFALMLFAGLMIFGLFSECLTRAPSLILNNSNYVKKVVFPLEILPWVTLGSALFHFVVSLTVWLVAYMFLFGTPHLTGLYLPVVVLPLMMLSMGLGWFLASLGVFLRDVGQIVGVLTSVLMFMSPIFYPASALPESYRGYLMLNPLTPIIEDVRRVLFMGTPPEVDQLLISYGISIIVFWLGFAWFQKSRKGFADVL